jgi:hypothetical protein
MYQVAFSMPFILNNSIEFVFHTQLLNWKLQLSVASRKLWAGSKRGMRCPTSHHQNGLPQRSHWSGLVISEEGLTALLHLTTVAMLALEIGINMNHTGRYWHLVAKSEFAKILD